MYHGCYNSTNQVAHFRLINHVSTCLPTYQPRRRLIIFNLSTSLCALWVTGLLWNMIVDRYGCAPRQVYMHEL